MTARKKPPAKKAAARRAAPMCKVAEPMREWSARLAEEMRPWPGIKVRPMFGMLAFYREANIFAALPAQRALYAPSAIAFKLGEQPATVARRLHDDSRILTSGGIGAGWFGFQMDSPAEIRDALDWLSLAYDSAAAQSKPGRRKPR